MKLNVIGGGPAGLYYAILHKKSFPHAEVAVFERNRPDDTFGFGIVLSDETLGNLKAADEPTYRDIAASFAYWDDIYVHYKGTVIKSSGHGFSGLKRLTLLEILQRRAVQLGVEIRYQTEITSVDPYLNAELVVAEAGTKFQVTETPRGLSGSGKYMNLLAYRGMGSFATEVTLTGRFFTAEEAHAAGVVDRVAPAGQYLEAARELAKAINKNPPLAVRASVMQRRWQIDDNRREAVRYQGLNKLYLSEDFAEATQIGRAHV